MLKNSNQTRFKFFKHILIELQITRSLNAMPQLVANASAMARMVFNYEEGRIAKWQSYRGRPSKIAFPRI